MSKLDGYKVGDRVRVTFEGVVQGRVETDPDLPVIWDGGRTCRYINAYNAEAPTFHIERIAQPVKVGGHVYIGEGPMKFMVTHIDEDLAVLWNGKYATAHPLSDLRHA